MRKTSDVKWMEDSWFAQCHAKELTEEFKVWWLEFYGVPEDYSEELDEQHEYWVRCAFALRGWLAACARVL